MSDRRTFSESVYRYLLRLYPSWFRREYGDEALQLFRARSHDEKGFLLRLRLWFDLLYDLGISLPREYRYAAEPRLSGVTALGQLEGMPAFHLLESEPPSAGILLCASMLALAVLCAALVLSSSMSKGGRFPGEKAEPDGRAHLRPSAARSNSPGNARGEAEASGSSRDWQSSSPADNPHTDGSLASSSSPSSAAGAQDMPTQQAVPQNATSAILQAYKDHDVVMFGELHGNKQEYEWLCSLVKTPDFADRVDDIVVESGNSLYQQTVDRYVAGGDVSFAQVQIAWRNMIASVPPVSPVYGWLYKAVREANLSHPGKHQIRLIMGSPPGDWDKIKSSKDLAPYAAEREQWYAHVVKDEVLAKHHRALLIMGAAHFLRGHDPVVRDQVWLQQHPAVANTGWAQATPGYIERTLRAAGANPYVIAFGANIVDNRGQVDRRFDSWPIPAITALSGTWPGKLPAQPVVSCGHASATAATLGEEADAMLYVGPCADLKSVDVPREELDGTPYGIEVARRAPIILGLPPQ